MDTAAKPLLLILHPDADTGRAVERLLREGMTPVETRLAHDEAELREILSGAPPTMVIGTDRVVAGDSTELLGLIAGPGKDIPFIALTEGEEEAEHLFALGARDVVSLAQPLRLRLAVQRELDTLAQRRTLRTLRETLRGYDDTLRELLEHSTAPAACVTAERHLYANPAYVERYGYHSLESLRDTPPYELLPKEERDTLRQALEEEAAEWHRIIREGGHDHLLALRRISLEGESCALLTLRPAAGARRLNDKLDYVGNRDRLTGLFNRGYFLEELALNVGRPSCSLIFLEAGGLETIRAEQGQAAANLVLQEISALLQHPLRGEESAARYGGPRFALILHRPPEEVEALADELRAKLIEYRGRRPTAKGCAVGVRHLLEERDAEEALEHARLAAGLAAERADGRCHVYHALDDAEHRDQQRAVWRDRLEAALEGRGGGFRLVYQPIVYLHASPVNLFEVLLRMVDDDGELLPPGQFLPIAEREGLSPRVDRWVLEEALSRLAEHRREGQAVRFFVKLSHATLLDEGFTPWLEQRLAHFDLPGEALILEVAEEIVEHGAVEVEGRLKELKALRCGLALERFGVSDEAARLIHRLPLDYVKFDGSLTHRLAANPGHRRLVENLSRRAQQAGRRSIVQFVEDNDTLDLLWELGIHYIQGYLLQAPDTTPHYDFDEPPL